ncbi:MAG: choice-of-anchor L domain-containing protein [Chitinophagales bacterium]
MKKIYTCFFVAFLLLTIIPRQSKAQLVVDTAISVSTMMHDFFDSTCVSISNVTYNGASVAVGFFDGSATNLGINAGIMMTSGSVYNAIGPNDNGSVSLANNLPGDDALNTIAAFPTYDACVIEMDIVPSLDTLYFKYSFGSEEYSEWVGTNFNDVFAFYVSGPGITGEQNIAVVPGNSNPVSVNSINCINSNQEYYVCNSLADCPAPLACPGDINETTLQYDGFTVPIAAQITVIPGETYHVKLAIADAGDGILDSGIFIGVESLCGDGQLKPVAGFSASQNDNFVQFHNLSRYATSYTWDFGDGITSTETNPTHAYAANGFYNVSLTTQNYCCTNGATETLNIGMATGVQTISDNSVQIFPNPSNGLVTVQLNNGQEGIVKLYNHAGVLLSSFELTSNATLDLSAYEKGIVFMQVIVNGKVYLKKIELN